MKLNEDFNSHAHVERDGCTDEQLAELQKISTHTLTWSVTLSMRKQCSAIGHFNSHAHVERDKPSLSMKPPSVISTHTLTWSVTLLFKWATFSSGISTHTLTWSVTTSNALIISGFSFQLTRSRGA